MWLELQVRLRARKKLEFQLGKVAIKFCLPWASLSLPSNGSAGENIISYFSRRKIYLLLIWGALNLVSDTCTCY